MKRKGCVTYRVLESLLGDPIIRLNRLDCPMVRSRVLFRVERDVYDRVLFVLEDGFDEGEGLR